MHRNSQFMERLFTLIMTGAYGLVMIWMFVSNFMGWTRGERSIITLVTTWIQYTIFLGGIFLTVLFFILLYNFKGAGDGHHHTHDHEGEDCAKEGCDHDHHDAHHHHDHDHEHSHDHKHEGHECCDHDHDHGWNPIRFIPLLIPLILIIMGLPDTRMIENFEKYRIDQAIKDQQKRPVVNEQMCWMMLGALSMPGEVFPQAAFSTSFASGVQSILDEMDDDAKDVAPIVTDLNQLEKVAQNPVLMQQYEAYRKIELEGMFNLEGTEGGYSYFRIIRMRMACCLTDSRPAMILCRTKKPLIPQLLDANKSSGTKWVKAQGRIKFARDQEGKIQPYFKVVSVEMAPMPPFPYIN